SPAALIAGKLLIWASGAEAPDPIGAGSPSRATSCTPPPAVPVQIPLSLTFAVTPDPVTWTMSATVPDELIAGPMTVDGSVVPGGSPNVTPAGVPGALSPDLTTGVGTNPCPAAGGAVAASTAAVSARTRTSASRGRGRPRKRQQCCINWSSQGRRTPAARWAGLG